MTEGGEQLIAGQLAQIHTDMGRLMEWREVDRKESAESRRLMHETQNEHSKLLLTLTHRVQTMEASFAREQETWNEYRIMREQAKGAGKLGAFLWRRGIWLMGAASGFMLWVYTIRHELAAWWHWLVSR
ncbi:hypothetical protein ACU5AY_05945 [Rhizobium sp. PAMB 3174]